MTRDRRIIEMPPPAPVRREVERLRTLQPPGDLLASVMVEVEKTPQSPRLFAFVPLIAGGLAAAAAAIVLAVILATGGGNVGGPDATATPVASAVPSALDELPPSAFVEGTVPVEPGTILTLAAFDDLWLANPFEGTVQRLDAATSALGPVIQVRPPSSGGRLWLAADDGVLWAGAGIEGRTLVALDPDTGETLRTIDLGLAPFTVTAGEGQVWFTDHEADLVVGVDASTGEELHRLPIVDPTGVTMHGTSVWVASSGEGTLAEVDRASGELLRTIEVAGNPVQIVPHDRTLYVLGSHQMPLTAVDADTGTVRRATYQAIAITIVDGRPWALRGDTFELGPIDPTTLELTAAVRASTGATEDLVTADEALWTVDANRLYRLRPAPP